MKSAAKAGDSEKVSAYIDYPSSRQSFKDQMNAYMVKDMTSKETNGWEALGAMMATTMVDKMVDTVVTPEGMTLMLQGKNLKDNVKDSVQQEESSIQDEHQPDYKSGYTSLNDFEIVVKDQGKAKDVKVLMVRNGLSWKINKIVVPLN
ncbi:DUF2939 domain-containing protein [Acinetobacter sp. Z1]|nr:DUF2939 domain-containing protein [Acinetobacter sp. Z1]